jgi:hypothetical protein
MVARTISGASGGNAGATAHFALSSPQTTTMSEYKDPWWAWPALIGIWAITIAFSVGIVWIIAHFVVKYW